MPKSSIKFIIAANIALLISIYFIPVMAIIISTICIISLIFGVIFSRTASDTYSKKANTALTIVFITIVPAIIGLIVIIAGVLDFISIIDSL